MTNLFIIKYRDGGNEAKQLRVSRNGSPTKKETSNLIYKGYTSWVNLDTILTQNRTIREKVIKIVGLV